MTPPASVRRFEYRHCRVSTGFEVEFVVNGKALFGTCKDVSDDGVRVCVDGSLEVGDSGLLILRYRASALEVEAQVAYMQQCHVGLIFVFSTGWERQVTGEFIASIASELGDLSVVRFP